MSDFSVIGKRVPRIDSREKVMGEAKYAADYSLPDMLWAKVARSPYAHAKILNIDTSRAEKLPGVKAVINSQGLQRMEIRIHAHHEGRIPTGH
jgi:CO/xanthine dehydrogenase Mo-binding subunit